jgi:sterol desaturase/sphingolipid hydroxylase (fatty acid hydroxylase superfamily)
MAETAIEPGVRRSGYRPKPEPPKHPLFQWPVKPLDILKYLFGFPGYLWPYTALFAVLAFCWWRFLAPPLEHMKTLAPGWVGVLLLANLALLVLVAGSMHWCLYARQAQGTDYKYNPNGLSARNPSFLFEDQLRENVFWSVCSAVPVWTAYEAVTFWLHASGRAPTLAWKDHAAYCWLLMLLMPVWIDLHFFTTHRTLHWPPLYRWVHSLHHKNVNPGPWSGLAMHPLEHVIYFSGVGLFWFLPSHPLHSLYLLLYLVLGDLVGHHGFDRIVLSKRFSLGTNHYMHYLHHKYVTVNFGTGVLPFDRLLGTFHDGSEGALERIRSRRRSGTLASHV